VRQLDHRHFFRHALAFALAVVGCSGGSAPPVTGDFVAQNADFKGYQSWTSFTIDDGLAAGSTHVAGKRTIYINQLPPADATEFPVGTIIVKETAVDGKIFARAKRGGDYNATGATGWEWFELATKMGVTGLAWRGKGPPSGEVYGGDPNAGCNPCHKIAVNNDAVLTPALMLATSANNDAGVAGDAGADAAETSAADAGATDTMNETDVGLDAGAETGTNDTSHE
jgi:hypothetical protein